MSGELNGVIDEIPKHLLDANWIGPDIVIGCAPIRRHDEFLAMNVGARDLERVARDGVTINALLMQIDLAGRDAREIEKVVDQSRLELHIAADDVDVFAKFSGSSEIFSAMKLAAANAGVSGVRNS